jgi:hypothetical protein
MDDFGSTFICYYKPYIEHDGTHYYKRCRQRRHREAKVQVNREGLQYCRHQKYHPRQWMHFDSGG